MGFTSIMASDHFHPWVPSQGQSGYVWSWLGALGAVTSKNLRFGTGVTPPGPRYHPAIIAQASATLEQMFPGRFWLGLGAGEALNEHITGEYWPEAPTRLEKLAEGIEIIQRLFTGKVVKYNGKHFKLESAKLYTRGEKAPPIYVATAGPIQSERTGKTLRRHHHPRRGGREDQDADGPLREGRARGGQGPLHDAAHHPGPRLLGRYAGRGDRERGEGVAERRHELPEGRHPQPRGLRGDVEAGPPGELQEPRADLARPRRPHRAPEALRRHRLQRDLRPQRRAQPGSFIQAPTARR